MGRGRFSRCEVVWHACRQTLGTLLFVFFGIFCGMCLPPNVGCFAVCLVLGWVRGWDGIGVLEVLACGGGCAEVMVGWKTVVGRLDSVYWG